MKIDRRALQKRSNSHCYVRSDVLFDVFSVLNHYFHNTRLLRCCGWLLLPLLCSRLLLSEEKPWIEVRSPHFRLITNGSERDGRHMAREFELMRAVFEAQFPGFKLDSPAPLLIIAPKDEYSTKQLLPQFWAHPGPKPAGIYHHGWEREYAIVRLDIVSDDRVNPDAYATVYHEYIHSLLHINFHWLPSWLDEGLAEFYGYTRFAKDKMYIGAPPRNARNVQFLDNKVSIPLSTFIQSHMFSRDAEQTHLSYMQAWALTHFLTFGPGMQNGVLLKRFFSDLQQGMEQKKAFQGTFGNFDDLQQQYDEYIQKFAFKTEVLPIPARLDEGGFTARTMTLAETQAEMAAFHIRSHQWGQVRELTEGALKSDPKLSLAHEDMGFLQFNDGMDSAAIKEFTTASELDNKNYVALFAKIMASPAAKSSAPEDRDATHQGLLKVLDLKPDFAPAYVELAKLAILRGQLDLALSVSRKAEQLEPFRSGYHVLSGQILLKMNRLPEAAAEAAYVAQRWFGPDRDEALELWDRIPAASRPADGPAAAEIVKSEVAQGTVKNASCTGTSFAITLDSDGQSRMFKSEGTPVGFSDTLWVGRDHFSPCFHVQGLRVMLRYRPSKDTSYTGDLIYAGFRDDLTQESKATTVQPNSH
jgi:tetratricopeptide (TPR) repeat protein